MIKKKIDAYIAQAAADILEKHARDEGIAMAEIAARGKISPPALSQIKHHKRNLTPELGAKLATSLNMSIESFYMDLTRQALLMQEEEKKHHAVFFAGADYLNGVSALISSLEPGDKYWLISIEKPIEFENHLLDELLLAAVSKGATINYVFPSLRYEELLEEGSKAEEDSRLILEEHGDAELDKRFFVWKKRFARRYPNYETATQNFHCYHALSGGDVWFAPLVKYILIERKEIEGSELKLNWENDEAWLDVAYYDQLSVRQADRCSLPLAPRVVRSLKQWCNNLTEEVVK